MDDEAGGCGNVCAMLKSTLSLGAVRMRKSFFFFEYLILEDQQPKKSETNKD